ncbi:TetR family transcriptional regulator [Leucobacter allii]|uniref:TetR family transcriptional regulator n=1 Tax=Leucobacter allii TaxID=2932247 RepID=A0ABY4FNT6_9MICO|nr:TetR family transcriptional regulator [Leucobacter allii]UOQ57879.1 TetR family transcriptional regulator [Leucobacter allii]UOR02520.1 TetR family transcriptional regulator [Leucobacter allii]
MRSELPIERDADSARPPAAGSRSFIEAARREQLIAAATVTVNEIGYHRASLAEIAGRAGIAKSAVAYYFSSKEGLLLELVQTVFEALGERVLRAVDGVEEPAARLRGYAEAYLAHVDAEREALAAAVEIVVSHRTADGTPLYLVADEDDAALVRSILRAGMADGAFQPMPLDVATGLVESVLDRAITLVQRDPGADLGPLRAHAVPFLFRALGAADG